MSSALEHLRPSSKVIINTNDIRRLSWTRTHSPSGMSRRERDLFHILSSALALKPQALIVRTTIGELARAHTTTHIGACSPSTCRRALADLERRGFLRRRTCRLGESARGLEIVLEPKRWAFWTRKRAGNVTPITVKPPTSVHISPGQSLGLPEDRTMTRSRVNTSNSYISSNNNQHKGRSKKTYRFHPIIFSLMQVLRSEPDKKPLLERAQIELSARDCGVLIENPSGVDWDFWEQRWAEFSPKRGGTREITARAEIVPLLRGQNKPRQAEPRGHTEIPGPTPEQITEIHDFFERPKIEPAPDPDPGLENWAGSDNDLRILLRARARARARGIDSE